MGYIRGKQWVIDPLQARHEALECWARLHRIAGKAGFGSFVKYSHVTRAYSCEVHANWIFQKSAQTYRVSETLQYGESPIEAAVNAYRQCLPLTPIVALAYLECELQLLKEAIARARKIETAIEFTEDVLILANLHAKSLIHVTLLPTWDEVFSDMEKSENGSYVDRAQIDRMTAKPLPAAPDEDDDL